MSSIVFFNSIDGDITTDSNLALAESDTLSILAACRGDLPLLPLHQLSFDKHLGSGTSFEMNRETYNNTQDPNFTPYYVAVKHVRLQGSNNYLPTSYSSVINELRVLTHPTLKDNDLILRIIAYGWKDTLFGIYPYLVVDYSDHGSLTHYLKKIKPTLWERQQLALDISAGLQALHQTNIIHGDVKPDNVLVFDTNDMSRAQMAKLADFGGAIFERDIDQVKIYGGTALYKAPELCARGNYQQNGKAATTTGLYRADVYSFGITLWEIMQNGQTYIEKCWYESGEAPIHVLQRITDDEEDAILIRARHYCTELRHGKSSGTIVSAVEETFEVTLPDNPERRLDIGQVLIALAGGTELQRPKSVYPLIKSHPPSKPKLPASGIVPSQVDVRGAFTGWHLVVQESEVIRIRNSETEGQTLKERTKGGPSTTSDRPPPTGSASFLPLKFDIFQTTRASPMPWNIQCDAAQQLHQEVPEHSHSTWSSKPELYHVCLQLAAYYHTGFGVKPCPEKTFKYLNMSRLGDETGRAIYSRVALALASDMHHSLLMDHRTELDELLETFELDSKYFSVRIRLQLQLYHARNRQGSGTTRDAQDIIPCTTIAISELEWLGQGLEENHSTQVELSNALTQACQHGDTEAALKLCNSLETFIPNNERPNPLHWLIMFTDEDAAMLASALIGSSVRPGPCRAHINTFPSAGTGISFYPEHCMDLSGTPLHWARGSVLHFSTANASSGDTILRGLIATNAVLREDRVINATDSSGWTAMHHATYFGDLDAVQALLEYDADASLKSIAGRTALDECVKLLNQISARGLGIDHNRVRRRGVHAIDSFIEYLRVIKRSLEDHIKV